MSKKKALKLSLKEARFVDAFLGTCAGNATEACLSAGYTRNRKSAAEIGSRLLRKIKIAKVMKARELARDQAAIATADERDTILTGIARELETPALVRITAVKELNKCTGRHSMKHVHEGKLTLEEAIGASRK